MEKKEEVFFEICNAVLKLEVQKGHLLWKISDVARVSGITRSLIYYYFGKEKQVILAEAWKFMLQLFFESAQDNQSLGLVKRMTKILDYAEKMPYLLVLFYLERGKDTEFGHEIKRAEEKLFDRLGNEFPHLSQTEIRKIYILELGAVVFNLNPEDLGELFSFTQS